MNKRIVTMPIVKLKFGYMAVSLIYTNGILIDSIALYIEA